MTNINDLKYRNLSLRDYLHNGMQSEMDAYAPTALFNSNEFLKYGIRIADILSTKNTTYGNAVAVTDKEGIYVRMFDKFSRVLNVSQSKADEVTDESIKDTMHDIAGYAILWIMIDELSPVFYDKDGKLILEETWRESEWIQDLKEILDGDSSSEIITCQRCRNRSFDKHHRLCYNCDGGMEVGDIGKRTKKDPLEENTILKD